MAATQIRVRPDRLREVAREFRQSGEQTQQLVQQLSSSVTSLQSEWQGITQRDFYERYRECTAQMQRYVTLLNTIGKQLDHIAAEFQRVDQTVARGRGAGSGGSYGRPAPGTSYRDSNGVWHQIGGGGGGGGGIPAATVPQRPGGGSNMSGAAVVAADIATDLTPGVSNVKDASIFLTGTNPVTGEQVDWPFRAVAGITMIPGIGNAAKVLVTTAKVGRTAARASRGAQTVETVMHASRMPSGVSRTVTPGPRVGYAAPPRTHVAEAVNAPSGRAAVSATPARPVRGPGATSPRAPGGTPPRTPGGAPGRTPVVPTPAPRQPVRASSGGVGGTPPGPPTGPGPSGSRPSTPRGQTPPGGPTGPSGRPPGQPPASRSGDSLNTSTAAQDAARSQMATSARAQLTDRLQALNELAGENPRASRGLRSIVGRLRTTLPSAADARIGSFPRSHDLVRDVDTGEVVAVLNAEPAMAAEVMSALPDLRRQVDDLIASAPDDAARVSAEQARSYLDDLAAQLTGTARRTADDVPVSAVDAAPTGPSSKIGDDFGRAGSDANVGSADSATPGGSSDSATGSMPPVAGGVGMPGGSGFGSGGSKGRNPKRDPKKKPQTDEAAETPPTSVYSPDTFKRSQ